MKIDIREIKELHEVNTSVDFSEEIKDHDDIISIEPCYVKGTLEFEYEELFVNLDIDVKLVLASSRSLTPVDYQLQFRLDLIFGESEDADFVLTEEILLGEIIYGHILLEKPLTIYLDDELEEDDEKPKKVHPAFKDLAEW